MGLPSGNLLQFANWKMAIEILDLHSYKMVIFHTHVSFPEGFNKFAAFQSIGRSLMIGQQFTGVIWGEGRTNQYHTWLLFFGLSCRQIGGSATVGTEYIGYMAMIGLGKKCRQEP